MQRRISSLAETWALMAGVILLVIVAVTTTNVGAFALDRVARNWGGTVSGLPGYEDFVRLAISCAAPMFLPYCQLKRGHIVVDLFARLLGPHARRGLDRAWAMGIAAVAAALAVAMGFGLVEVMQDNALSRVLGWPEWPFYVPGLLSLGLWSLVAGLQALGLADE